MTKNQKKKEKKKRKKMEQRSEPWPENQRPEEPGDVLSCSQECNTADTYPGGEEAGKGNEEAEVKLSESSEEDDDRDSIIVEFKRKIKSCIRRTKVGG